MGGTRDRVICEGEKKSLFDRGKIQGLDQVRLRALDTVFTHLLLAATSLCSSSWCEAKAAQG